MSKFTYWACHDIVFMEVLISHFVNHRHTCTARVTILVLCVCVCICRHLFSCYMQQGSQKSIPTSSMPHRLDFFSDFCESTAFKSYGMKHEWISQYANEHCLTSTSLCRFVHWYSKASNATYEYCYQKEGETIDWAHGFVDYMHSSRLCGI